MKWWEILLRALTIIMGSVGLFSFIEFMIKRKDEKNALLKEILERLNKAEKDSCRTQMLVLMSDYPEEKKELVTIAEHYFKKLHGNWYMTALFGKHLKANGIEPPAWYAAGAKGEEEK